MMPSKAAIPILFLSTLSLRRATWSRLYLTSFKGNYFYPRSPCGERPPPKSILVHYTAKFLSTLSLRRATTGASVGLYLVTEISIHALLAESDESNACQAQ